jgi:hypothetical protein
MHRREHVHAAGGEDPRDLGDHAVRIRHEHERVLMKDDVEFAAAESAQVAHVGPQILELGTATSRETPDRRELSARDVHERGGRAQLGEEDRVPAATARERKHALSVEVDAFERAVRDAIEESALPRLCSRRGALRTRVRDARFRESLPHALVVRTHLIDRDALCHAEIVAA